MSWNFLSNLQTLAGPLGQFCFMPIAEYTDEVTAALPAETSTPPTDFANVEKLRTADDFPYLKVDIQPSGTVADSADGACPYGAIRLHAVTKGVLFFFPSYEGLTNVLVLQMTDIIANLTSINAKLPWFYRWVEGQCLPDLFIYENVDVDHLGAYLRNYDFLVNDTLKVMDDTIPTEDYINSFLSGDIAFPLLVEAGAVVGQAAIGGSDRQISFHARYSKHAYSSDPWPMSPTELFSLFFADDSSYSTVTYSASSPTDQTILYGYGMPQIHFDYTAETITSEAVAHPLLFKMNELGIAQLNTLKSSTTTSTLYNISHTLLLRPPLRTHARVIWEAQRERRAFPSNWGVGSSCQKTNFIPDSNFTKTDSAGTTRRFLQPPATWQLTDIWKCNYFAYDVCARSGFHIPIVARSGSGWHYASTTATVYALTDLGANASATEDREALVGAGSDNAKVWGWRIDNLIRATGPQNTDQVNKLNQLMETEGRCLLAMRNDWYATPQKELGHFVKVKKIYAIEMTTTADDAKAHGVKKLELTALYASSATAKDTRFTFGTAGDAYHKYSDDHFHYAYIFELTPGRDPDTLWGLQDLLTIINNTGNG